MAQYKLLNNGGVVLRILNPDQKTWNKITALTGDHKDFLNITVPQTTSGIEIKMPIEDLITDPVGGFYWICELNVDNNTTNVFTLDELPFGDIPIGGDGTWHYYTLTI